MKRIRKALSVFIGSCLIFGAVVFFTTVDGKAEPEPRNDSASHIVAVNIPGGKVTDNGYTLYSGVVDGQYSAAIKVKTGLISGSAPYVIKYDKNLVVISAKKAYNLCGYVVIPSDGRTVKLSPAETVYAFDDNAKVFFTSEASQNGETAPAETDTIKKISDIRFGWADKYYAILNSTGKISQLYIARDGYGMSISDVTTGDNLYSLIQKFKYIKGSCSAYVDYFLYDPTQGGNKDVKYPLMILIHGMGGGLTPYSPFYTNGYPQLWASEKRQGTFKGGGAYIMLPRCTTEADGTYWFGSDYSNIGSGHSEYTQYIVASIKEVIKNNPNVDTNRIYIGGFSLGGMMTWYTVLAEPGMFAAAFPTCATYAPTAAELESIGEVPIWLFQGYYDEVAKYEQYASFASRYILKNLADKNTDSRVSIFKNLTDGRGMFYYTNHCAWFPVEYNMTYSDGSYYGEYFQGNDFKGVMKDIGGHYSGTLTDWLNAQNLAARRNAAGIVNSVHIAPQSIDINVVSLGAIILALVLVSFTIYRRRKRPKRTGKNVLRESEIK